MKSLKLISLALAMLFSILSFGQEITITGTVTDETKTPIPGVSVTIKGTQKSTTTDFNGHYSIEVHKGKILVFSFIGYNTYEKIVKENAKIINVSLSPNTSSLEEIVVVGYANTRKVKLRSADAVVYKENKSNNTVRVAAMAMPTKAKAEYITEPSQIYGNTNTVNINHPLPSTPNQEDYEVFVENQFETPKNAPLSTFSIDVDNASYTNIRRFINNGQAVPKDAVRIEEMMNFFKYSYPQPKDNHPFSINTEYSDCPWNSKHQLLKIGLQGKNIPTENLPASNLVFLIDVSGSMSDPNKLPLLKQSMKILVNELRKEDKVAMVVYAGAAGLVLPPTSGDQKQTIIDALDNLNAGGSTAGGAGIELAYKTAIANFIKGGNNRVILATDGDFNVGTSSNKDMETLIEEKRKSGVFLTCLGYGMGNYKDSKMEILANKGNGNYAYIDNIQEANRFLGKEFKGSMFAIAKDVKIQIEFNPKHVQAYRLIGYENRKLRPEDFKNDAIDTGELGSGHTVTALYEIIPTGIESDYSLPDLKYTQTANTANYSNELATIKFRYKKPDGEKSIEMIQTIEDKTKNLATASEDFKFSAAVAWFGLKLRDSKLVTDKESKSILKLSKQALSKDPEGYKAEFVRLVEAVQ
jgi:Ca-activated chloride channel family protein